MGAKEHEDRNVRYLGRLGVEPGFTLPEWEPGLPPAAPDAPTVMQMSVQARQGDSRIAEITLYGFAYTPLSSKGAETTKLTLDALAVLRSAADLQGKLIEQLHIPSK